MSLGLGRFDGAHYSQSNNSKNHQSGKNFIGTGEAKPLSLAQKFSRIVDSATGIDPVFFSKGVDNFLLCCC